MANWYDALDVQSEILAFWRSELGIRYGLNFQDSMNGNRKGGDKGQVEAGLPVVEGQKMMAAEPIWVNDEVMDLVEAAAESFEPEPLLASDLIFPHGFVLLPRPAYLNDVNGKRMAFRAFAWLSCAESGESAWTYNPKGTPESASGIHFSLYGHRDDDDDFDHHGEIARWTLAHFTPWMFGSTLDQAVPEVGENVNGRVMTESEVANMRKGQRSVWGLTQVLFRLAQQHVLVYPRERAPRHARKRAQRLKLNDTVNVMHLRKGLIAPGEGEGDGSYLTHRFPVSGHWRWQWYPSEKVHRQKWIRGYIKGPSGAPLIVKDRVANFVR
jgi:hypothetical protein